VRNRGRRIQRDEGGRVAVAITRHPREFVGIVLAALATVAIFVNALFLQQGPHPAPIFATRHLLVPPQSAPRFSIVKPTNAPSAPVHNDPIAELIAPTQRVVAVQRALADFGFGQIKATGVVGPETRVAIEKFERDHHMPVTGQISDHLVRELTAMTGRPLE
jgi:Putative peptidoglycan binding domain